MFANSRKTRNSQLLDSRNQNQFYRYCPLKASLHAKVIDTRLDSMCWQVLQMSPPSQQQQHNKSQCRHGTLTDFNLQLSSEVPLHYISRCGKLGFMQFHRLILIYPQKLSPMKQNLLVNDHIIISIEKVQMYSGMNLSSISFWGRNRLGGWVNMYMVMTRSNNGDLANWRPFPWSERHKQSQARHFLFSLQYRSHIGYKVVEVNGGAEQKGSGL